MEIKKGTKRIVVIIPIVRIVIKFPVVHLREAIKGITYYGRDKEHLKWYLFSPVKQPGGFKHLLFRGLVDNLGERRFYRKIKHPFLQPTFFSFFGLFNIQKIGRMLPESTDPKWFWGKMLELTQSAAKDDDHHFYNAENFCLEKGKLKTLDYGRPKTQEIILKYGNAIMEGFSLEKEDNGT